MTFEVSDILALIKGEEIAGDQWRVIRPFIRLRQQGINARWARADGDGFIPTDPAQTVLIARQMSGDDTASVDRWLGERRPVTRAIVYEMDDLNWGEPMVEHLVGADYTRGKTPAELFRIGEVSRYFASQCDGVIVSSEPLAELVRRETHAPVIVVPNAIDTRWFRAQMSYRPGWAEHLTIGWCGGRRPERDVAEMATAWGRVAKRHPEVKFVVAAPVIPDVFYREIENTEQIIRLPYVSWEDAPNLYQVDIGCCAVADTEFSRAKTPIKALEYGTAGAAVVATRTLYRQVIEDGKTGLLAETVGEWEAALESLILQPKMRRRLNIALQAKIERHHSLDVNVHRWPAAVAEIVDAMAGRAAA